MGRSLWDTIFLDHLQEHEKVGFNSFRYSIALFVRDHRIELNARHRNGRMFPIEMTISAPQTGTGLLFSWIFIRDISARKKREEELKRARDEAESRARTLQILNGISRELSTSLDSNELFNKIGKLLFQLVEYSTFSVRLLDSTRQILSHRFPLSGSLSLDKKNLSLNQGLVGVAARTGKPVVVNNVKSDPRYIEIHSETRSECIVPLIVNNKLIGVLDIENSTPYYFQDHHVQALRILASQIAITLATRCSTRRSLIKSAG
jgi:putative methionine-R-sulfoxide reductase with GAF domain